MSLTSNAAPFSRGSGGGSAPQRSTYPVGPTPGSYSMPRNSGAPQSFQQRYSDAYNTYSSFGAPSLAQLQSQQSLLGLQMGAQDARYGLAQQAAQAGYGFDRERLGLAQQELGIDRGALMRQQGYYDDLYGIDREKYGQNVGYQNRLGQFNFRSFGVTKADLARQAAQTQADADRQQRGLRSDLTAAGAYTSQGGREGRRDIDTARASQLRGIDLQGQAAQIGYERDQAGIQNTIANLTSDFKASGLTTAEQKARLQDRMAALDLKGRELGINGRELASRLEQGLASLNLDQIVSMGQLMDAVTSNNAAQAQWANDVMMKAFEASMGGG
jgi:hypothetical protein